MVGAQTKPFRTVVIWQIAATVASVMLGAWFAGMAGAVSTALGGSVAVAGSLVYIVLLPRRTQATPWDALGGMLRAEGAKIGVMVVLLWLVLAVFKQVVVVGFIGTFALAVIIFSMAIFVRNPATIEMD